MTTLTGGQALVASLAAHHVDTVFGIPGTHNLGAYAALAEYGIRHISTRHEQGAGYAADGYARSTGRPGVVLTTTGPAILNAATAAAQAYSDSIPLILISPGMPLCHPGKGNGLLHEAKDQSAAMNAITECSLRVTSVPEISLGVAQAFATATTGRPRPVHLEIPLDLLDETADVSLVRAVHSPVGGPDPTLISRAASRMQAAAKPLLIAGGGAQGAGSQVQRLAETLGAPVITTTNGKGTIPEDHRLAVGAGVHHASVTRAINDSDCVIAVGTELAPSDWWYGLPDLTGKLIRIDIDATAINTNAPPDVALVAASAPTLELLLSGLRPTEQTRGAEAAQQIRDQHRVDAATEGKPWLEIIDAIASALPRDSIVAGDSAMACYYGAVSNLPLHRTRSFLYPTGFGTLGYGLPAGIGAKVANPEAPVLVLHGDGGLMFTVAELATAAELNLPMPIVVVDNGGYGEIHNEMVDRHDRVHAVALGAPDFPALARALGCYGQHVDNPTELEGAIRDALTADRPTLIHIYEDSRASQGLR